MWVTTVALTVLAVLVRFVRWQYLLRRAGVRIPARGSLLAYLASLVGWVTPFFAGEALRCVLIRTRFGVPMPKTLAVFAAERALDIVALAMIGAAGRSASPRLVAAIGGIAILAGAAWALMRPARVAARVTDVFTRIDLLLVGLAASLVSWQLLAPATRELFTGFTRAGDWLTTTVALVGAVAAAAVLRAPRTPAAGDAAQHFDDIAGEYGRQWSDHVWNHLLQRKVGMMTAALPAPAAAGPGLDLGCGLGHQCIEIGKRGYRVVGMDISAGLLRHAKANGATVTVGSATALPFRSAGLDFIYAVGVLHHLPDRAAQDAAGREVVRALRPGGRLLVHESNPRNPLYRFYMGYVFPILKKIDEGTEWWIEPERWGSQPGLRLVRIEYFTFMPDFVPAFLMKPVLAVDRWLERSPLRRYSVHYFAVLEREDRT